MNDSSPAAGALTIKRVYDDAALDALVPAWRELLGRAENPVTAITPLWLGAWWRTFGTVDKRALRALSFWDGERLIGFAPLLARFTRHRGVIPFRRIELVGTGEDEANEICSDYAGVVVEAGSEARVAEALAGALEGPAFATWDELVFDMMDGRSKFPEAFRKALTATGAQVALEQCGGCPYVPLPATFEAYLKKLDTRSRYLVNRALRELDKWAGEDGWRLHRASTVEELATGKRALVDLHREQWAKRGKGGAFAGERFRQFHDEVMLELLRGVDGSLDLLWLTVRDRPVAALYNIVHANVVSLYQSGRTDDVPNGLRIGTAMNALAIRDAIEKGRFEYDFLNGNVQYKRQLSFGDCRPLVTLRAISSSARARALEATRKTADALIARARVVRDAIAEKRGGSEAPAENDADDPAASGSASGP
ncbi:MAG: GNAT family N-acetyltransferase [Polyangiaceae bacterium]